MLKSWWQAKAVLLIEQSWAGHRVAIRLTVGERAHHALDAVTSSRRIAPAASLLVFRAGRMDLAPEAPPEQAPRMSGSSLCSAPRPSNAASFPSAQFAAIALGVF